MTFMFTLLPLLFLIAHLSIAGSATQQQILRPAGEHETSRQISTTLFADLEELSRLVDIAYCVGSFGLGLQKPFECLSRCAEFADFELVTTWNTGPLLSDSCGYIALSHAPNAKRLIVAFRGTYSLANTIADLSTVPQQYLPYPGEGDSEQISLTNSTAKCDNCTVHYGFYSSWRNTRSEILPHIEAALHDLPGYELVLVGHSLGGAVAALAGLELLAKGYQPHVTTFGEPRLGNTALASYIDERFGLGAGNGTQSKQRFRRVTHMDDPVPQLPLEEWGYMPHGGEIYIAKSELPPSVVDIFHCDGDADPSCINHATGQETDKFWTFPSRFKPWKLIYAHRDYFWRLGVCLPTFGRM